ncbi:MAG: hypothetical protein GF320_21970 [Armatimonadia bacterium]|nr:hypothetical protein [Armatimonadia bacterium]
MTSRSPVIALGFLAAGSVCLSLVVGCAREPAPASWTGLYANEDATVVLLLKDDWSATLVLEPTSDQGLTWETGTAGVHVMGHHAAELQRRAEYDSGFLLYPRWEEAPGGAIELVKVE